MEAQLGADGCATQLRMEDPDPGYVACISEQLSLYRCPCRDVVSSRFLGLDHGECKPLPCGTGELRCPAGLACVERECVSRPPAPKVARRGADVAPEAVQAYC